MAVYLTWANPVFLVFFALSPMSKLRGINAGVDSDSPRLHHCKGFELLSRRGT